MVTVPCLRIMEYACTVWSPHTRNNTKGLIKKDDSVVKMITYAAESEMVYT